MKEPARRAWLAGGLAFVAGYVDTCGFVALFGLFTAHVTGNFVTLGAALAGSRTGLVAKLCALPVFIACVAGLRVWLRHELRAGRNGARRLLVVEIVLLGAFALAGVAGTPFASADAWPAVTTGMLGVAALATQNTAARTVFATLTPSTVMTGNVTQAVLDSVDLLAEPAGATRDALAARLRAFLPPIGAFAVGAVGGGVAFLHAGYACLALPIAVLSALALAPTLLEPRPA